MFLTAVKLRGTLFWMAIAAGFLTLLLPQHIPLILPLALAVAWAGVFLYTVLHIVKTRRHGLRCPHCGWVPFALNAWKCKECKAVWDAFSTNGVCPRCGHEHEEIHCVRCRRRATLRDWHL